MRRWTPIIGECGIEFHSPEAEFCGEWVHFSDVEQLVRAAQAVLDAYESRFEVEATNGRCFGPIDDEIKALRAIICSAAETGDSHE
jgi:hypothetical protein